MKEEITEQFSMELKQNSSSEKLNKHCRKINK